MIEDSVFADFHVHTHLSPCGKPEATAGAMIRRAWEKGLSAIGFADHVTPLPVAGCAFYDFQRPALLEDLRSEITECGESADRRIFVGLEADYTMAGRECLDMEILKSADHVVCAASHFHLPASPKPSGKGPRETAELMLRMASEALVVPGVSIWAHPFACSRMRPLEKILEFVRDDELAGLIHLAGKREIAIEINGGPAREEDYRRATERFFRMARDLEARFTLTADAHHPDDLDRLDVAEGWARVLGVRDDHLLTVHELEERQRRKRERFGTW